MDSPLVKELSQYKTYAIPMVDIWVDPKFNCRDMFLPDAVKKLADSIATDGLQYPVIVRPFTEHPPHQYQLVAGFRRHAAFRLLKRDEIPAMVTEKEITDFEAHKLNLLENLERKDLNILEEARGIRHIFPHGENITTIARELGRERPWVYRRLALLELPIEVQYMVASERLNQHELDLLLALKSEDEETINKKAKELLAAKKEGRSKAFIRDNKKGKFVDDRRRTKGQIADMIAIMFGMGISGLPARVAAWCAGNISDEELKSDMIAWSDRAKSNDCIDGGTDG